MKAVFYLIIGAFISSLVGIFFSVIANWFKNKMFLVNYYIKSKEVYFNIEQLNYIANTYANELLKIFKDNEIIITHIKKQIENLKLNFKFSREFLIICFWKDYSNMINPFGSNYDDEYRKLWSKFEKKLKEKYFLKYDVVMYIKNSDFEQYRLINILKEFIKYSNFNTKFKYSEELENIFIKWERFINDNDVIDLYKNYSNKKYNKKMEKIKHMFLLKKKMYKKINKWI
ncbi:hypothetical protein [Spiroplasma endosymbiont of Tiphia femorata]|uniref:hypothetical protein n=1 Tax=Spiroplasma endosymbiont of Tiphia femorata TaxID=3066326 RepID=UPI0030CC788B